MDSTLAVQQFIQQTIRRDPANLEAILKMPEAQDEGVWKYEHLRYIKKIVLSSKDPKKEIVGLQITIIQWCTIISFF